MPGGVLTEADLKNGAKTGGLRPVGEALKAKCPECDAPPGHPCVQKGKVKVTGEFSTEHHGGIRAPHVERGRAARWEAMGI
jgi:hypothetical protein